MDISLIPPDVGPVIERISLQPPEAPAVYTRIRLTPIEQVIPSPQKRTRSVGGFFKRKKRGSHKKPLPDVSLCNNLPFDLELASPSVLQRGQENEDLLSDMELSSIGGDLFNPNPIGFEIQDDSLAGSDFDMSFAAYVDTMAAHAVSIIQICDSLFVAQGWNARYNSGTELWYHLHRKKIGENEEMACFCSQGKSHVECFHVLYMKMFGENEFPAGCQGLGREEDKAILFLREERDENSVIEHFSVPSPASRKSRSETYSSRAIVVHEGGEGVTGQWSCSRDKGATLYCAHIRRAQHHLKVLNSDSPNRLMLADMEEPEGLVNHATGEHVVRAAVTVEKPTVSYLPVLPPTWCWIPNDVHLYNRPTPIQQAPPLLILDDLSRCPCGQKFNPLEPIIERIVVLYTLVRALPCNIQIQRCPSCLPALERTIGPEPRNLGIFNFNNRQLIAHDLFDDYTSAFTTSETPFIAWIKTVSRRYKDYGSSWDFLYHKTFRSAWFAYAKLQAFESDMQCPECGPYPEYTIWDGTALRMNEKYVLPTIKPPTVSDKGSTLRGSRYVGRQQAIEDTKLRRDIRQIIEGPRLLSREELAGLGASATADGSVAEKLAQSLELVVFVENVCTALSTICPGLGSLFRQSYSAYAASMGFQPDRRYITFFKQLAAEESVLQLANRPALTQLGTFLTDPTSTNASQLIGIPSLLNVLLFHQGTYPSELLEVCRWLFERGCHVLGQLLKHATDEPKDFLQEDWSKTGCYYSLPQIRMRPKYPSLAHDIRSEPAGSRGAKCSKFYAEYGKRKLTGGIMAVWCTHIISYGFHCIPVGEGRNDVFSAIYTRWPKAPKYIVYDFACALGPYCMTREPDYFADSTIVIDGFHAPDHTKCDESSFLSSYAAVDPRLHRLNSSAAECGNGGLKRIRKVVRYLGQERAMIYTRVFLAVWNRARIRKLLRIED